MYPTESSFISALNGNGLSKLKLRIDDFFNRRYRTVNLFVPYSDYKFIKVIHEETVILEERAEESGMFYKISVEQKDLNKVQLYVISE